MYTYYQKIRSSMRMHSFNTSMYIEFIIEF